MLSLKIDDGKNTTDKNTTCTAIDPPGIHFAPSVRWAVETRGLTLFHADLGAFCCIPYPYAAIWDLLHRGYRFDEAARMMQHIADVSPTTARNLMLNALKGWLEQGVLRKDGDDGEPVDHLDL